MKKLATLCIAFILTVCSMMGGLVGCSRDPGEEFNTDASHLYVGAYAAGYGTQFAKDLKIGFEEHWKNESFEEGKMGVQVHVLDALDGQSIMGNFEFGDYEVIFTGNADYYQYVEQKKIIPITDVLNDNLNEYGENKSIASRLSEDALEALKIGNDYYSVPYVTSNYGVVINVDVWDSKELYFAKGGCPSEYYRASESSTDIVKGRIDEGLVDAALAFPEGVTEWNDDMYAFCGYDAERSAGPDGKYGTLDDGQPATFEEFFAFCSNAKYAQNVQPIHWPGKGTTQVSKALIQFVNDMLGAEQARLRFTYDGVATRLIDVSETGEVTYLDPVQITNENGYLLHKQDAIYYVMQFIEELLQSNDYYVDTNNSTHTHTDAQDDFISGGIINGKPEIAMLVDGNWWMNEAAGGFDVITANYGEEYAAANRRFQMLSYPKLNNNAVGEPLTESTGNSVISAINSKIKNDPVKVRIAKEFLKFAFTNANNLAFTKTTGIIRALELDIPEGYLDTLPFFTKTELERQQVTEFFYDSSENDMVRYNYFNMFNSEIFWSGIINGDTKNVPNTAMQDGFTAIQLFRSKSDLWTKAYWDQRYSAFYDVAE